MKMKRLAVCALAAAMIGAGALTQVSAFNLGSVLGGVVKVGGIAILVDKYGASINSAINSVMMKEGAGTNYATKVVPIVSIGNKGYIGAAQVIGDADQVEKVKAVGQLEISWNDKLFRIKGLIPMDSVNPTSCTKQKQNNKKQKTCGGGAGKDSETKRLLDGRIRFSIVLRT